MKKLLILGLLVLGLSSCGQSLDTTDLRDEDGEEVTVGTLNNDFQDIQDCLNEGEYGACMRAKSKGFTAFPIFYSSIVDAITLKFEGQNFTYKGHDNDGIVFKKNLRIHRGDYYSNGSKFYTTIYITLEITKTWKAKLEVKDDRGNLISYAAGTNTIYRNGVEKWVDIMDNGWHRIETNQFNCNNFKIGEMEVKVI